VSAACRSRIVPVPAGHNWQSLVLRAHPIEVAGLWYRWPAHNMMARIMVVFVVAAAHALCFLLVVDKDSVKVAARTYARQLTLSCETFLSGPPAKAKG
jgi:hypothetical protein